MNLYKILLFLLIIETILCCESWFRRRHKNRRQHVMKHRMLHGNRKKGMINLSKLPKPKHIRRKEKNSKKIKFIDISTKTWQVKNNMKSSHKKNSRKPIAVTKKNKKFKVNNLQKLNKRRVKAKCVEGNTFIQNIYNIFKWPKEHNIKKNGKKHINKKINKGIHKHNKGIINFPFEVTTNKTELIDNSTMNPNLICIDGSNCSNNSECGNNGSCYNGKCRCLCREFSSCISNDDCPGKNSKCFSKCIGKNGTTIDCGTNHNKTSKYNDAEDEGYCSIGSQCLSGICIGGGRRKILDGVVFYEAISCSITSEDISCKGIGDEICTTENDLIFRHTNQSLIGTKEDISTIDKYHKKLDINFPACYSDNGNFVKCGEDVENSCIEGAYCGYCKC
ncbi:Hypothetical protein SRAE_1000137900 [Strongyloides ratti]|uniref:Uncharacterized protein n=1 Tax=Strongyloides ratti TaxID=34506 RepID=A0A090L6I2_STRRB|nr:Hypothetical protein SRAE_1000137900 [Strongyloides ratti]CEF63114.1 Hypothetical protein SRAE_1000137900 [Strongyloides ratti]